MTPIVVHLADYGGPYAGSFIPMVRAAAATVRARGWRFECGFTEVADGRAWLGDLARDDIEPWIAPAAARASLAEWVGSKLGPESGPLILHTHFTAFDLAAARIARQRQGAAAIWHFHSYLPSDPVRSLKAAVKIGLLGRSVEIVCVSEANVEAVRRRGAARDRVHLIRNGIDTAAFPPIGADERAAARGRLGLEADVPAYLHFAWDWEVKGGPLFARTMAALQAAGEPGVGLTVGAGDHALETAAELGLGDRLRPVEPTDDVAALYAAADALFATSAAEGMPFAMLESLSRGLPVIASDVPGHRIASPLPPGLRLAAMEPAALAGEAIALAGRDPGEREREAHAARAWVLAERDLSGWAARLLELYESVLSRASGSDPL
jgi:glycosyltransferase involved in cell wall biosynthesis